MVCSATAAGRLVPKFGTKPLFLVALLAIPIRGVLIVLLLSSDGGVGWLLATQVLDGLAGGVMGVLVVLVTEQLARYGLAYSVTVFLCLPLTVTLVQG